MNSFDTFVISYLNGFSGASLFFDSTMRFISDNHLIKGGLLIALIYYLWFARNKQPAYVREHIVATFISCFLAMVVARLLAMTLLFRVRPLHNPDLDFQLPYGMHPTVLEGWSSFPSDHAALFFSLAVNLFFVSRAVGAFAILYTSVVICFPRIYLGLHYPTDIIAGAVIGAAVAWAVNRTALGTKVAQPFVMLSDLKPGFFYIGFFIVTYQIADMFNASRALVSFLIKLV